MVALLRTRLLLLLVLAWEQVWVLVVLMLAVVLLVLLAWEQPRAQPWALQQGQSKGRQ